MKLFWNKSKGICIGFVLFLYAFLCGAQIATVKIDSLNLALEKAVEAGDSLEIISNLGYEYWTIDALKAIAYGRKGLQLSTGLQDQKWVAFNFRVIGVAYWVLGDYALALENLILSLDTFSELNDQTGKANVLMNLGLIYADDLDLPLAKKYFREAISLFETTGEEGRKATTYSKIASVLVKEDSLAKAESFLNHAIDVHQSNEFRYGVAEALNRKANLYAKRGHYDTSLSFLNQSIAISEEIRDLEGVVKSHVDLGEIYFQMDKYEKAKASFIKANELSQLIYSKKWGVESLKGLFLVFKEENNTHEAMEYFDKYTSLQDSISSRQKILTIANLKNEFEGREQLRELQTRNLEVIALQKEAKAKRLQFILLASLSFMALVITFLLFLINKTKNRFQRNQAEQKIKLAKAAEQLHKQELENSILREKELQKELDLKHRELAAFAVNFVQKTELIQEIEFDLQKGELAVNDIKKIRKKLSTTSRLDAEWEVFKKQFESVHPAFIETLKATHPTLTQSEVRHCILIRMNMSPKECAAVLGISPESIKTSRYRLRKKLKLGSEEGLFDYLTIV
jgi:tetratricopeptide (TPR) repeat protein/DNA-binding CsgD family transcriptional regulator